MKNGMSDNRAQIKIYLLLVLGICYILGVTAYFTQTSNGGVAYQILQKGFTAFPVTSAIFIRRITKDNSYGAQQQCYVLCNYSWSS